MTTSVLSRTVECKQQESAFIHSNVPEMNENPIDRKKPAILLVDDNNEILVLLEKLLEKNGYSVMNADNAEKAILIAKYQKSYLDLLITDVVMPGMNGIKMSKLILADNPALKCLYMSGHIPEHIDAGMALQEGVNFIRKPFRLNELIRLVHSFIGASFTPPPMMRGMLGDRGAFVRADTERSRQSKRSLTDGWFLFVAMSSTSSNKLGLV